MFKLFLDSRGDLIKWLTPCMPTCIALYRRVQFGSFTPASCLLSSIDAQTLARNEPVPGPWLVAFVDRTCRPETEVWIAASWEQGAPVDKEASWTPQAEALVRTLIEEIGNLDITTDMVEPNGDSHESTSHNSSSNGSGAVNRGQFEGHMSNSDIVLFGAVHETTFKILKNLGYVDPNFVGSDIPYRKYIFDLNSSSTPGSLPRDYVYGKVHPRDYWLVKSRTQIPRQDRTLRKLPSVAIYPHHTDSTTPAPIAWAFLGLDGSLTTLHVEPKYRGLGLAKSLALKLFSDDMEIYWQNNLRTSEGETEAKSDDKYAHADVATDNGPSQGVCKSLGGKWHFLVYWLRVNVRKV